MLVARIERLARDQEEARAQQPVIRGRRQLGLAGDCRGRCGAGLLLGYLIR